MIAESARKQGVKHIGVGAILGDADPSIASVVDSIEWIYAGQLNKGINFFRNLAIGHVIFAGQIKPTRLFDDLRPDWRAMKLLVKLRRKNAESIFSAVAAEFQKDGITILPASMFLEDQLATSGIIGKIKPSRNQISDMILGRDIAREISRLNIGQTVVIKNGSVLAVEAFEGTDKTIIRGGEIGQGGVAVIKVAKPQQDVRFDLPCIGLRTVESLIQARAKILAVQAGKTLLLDKTAVIAALDAAKIALVGIDILD